jgi:hypothetical protein
MTKDKLLNTISGLSIELFALAVTMGYYAGLGCKDKAAQVLAMSQTLREWAENGAREDLH